MKCNLINYFHSLFQSQFSLHLLASSASVSSDKCLQMQKPKGFQSLPVVLEFGVPPDPTFYNLYSSLGAVIRHMVLACTCMPMIHKSMHHLINVKHSKQLASRIGGLPGLHLSKLQRDQNTAARLLTKTKCVKHIMPALISDCSASLNTSCKSV